MLVEQKAPGVLGRLATAYEKAPSVSQRQAMVTLMGRIKSAETDTTLAAFFAEIGAESSHPEMLEYLEVFRNQPSEAAKSALSLYERNRPKEDGKPEWNYRECLNGGDRARGKALFETHLQAQCARCHRVGNKGSTVGPNLAGVGSRRDRRFLLRSIVAPSADIDAKYRSHVYRLDSGKVIQGLLLRESDETIVIANAQGKEVRIDVDEVEASKSQDSSIMPEVVKTLTRREIRDLVAYLESLKEAPKSKQ